VIACRRGLGDARRFRQLVGSQIVIDRAPALEKEHTMAGWIDRQVDSWFDRRIDRYVDKKLDAFLIGKMPDEDFEQLKVMTRKGQPLDAATEQKLEEQLGELFEPYKAVHNGAARLERINNQIKRVTRVLP
jgi:hypothetical protein